jgi:Big-like domain-containing protein
VISRRALVGAGAGAVVAMIGFGGCAKAVFPPGGPLDATPPRILATSPADSSVRVPRNAGVEILFSESMDHASVRDAVRIRPPAERSQFHWDGRRFRVYWRDPLQPNTTYHVVLRGSARDEHGIPLGATVSIHFSTGDSLTPGRIAGVVRAVTLRKVGVPILVFPAGLGTRPDTTAMFEPLYESSTDTAGVYSVAGVALGPSYRVFAFYDRNNNDSFDEDLDILAPSPEAIRLTPEHAVADSINIVAVDPRAPAILSGTILASDSTAHYRVEAHGVPDSTITRRVDRFGPGPFTLRVPAGSWKLRAQRVPGVDGTPTALEIRREDVHDLEAEEEMGGFNFDFRPFEGRTP